MGSEVCRTLEREPDLELVAAVDPRLAAGEVAHPLGDETARLVFADVEGLAAGGAEVAVDFTMGAAARSNARWCAEHGVHVVIGTSGLDQEDLEGLDASFGQSSANCMVIPNFAVGAVIMEHLAAIAAPHMDGAEIIELHHDAKVDAPSGTALHTAEMMAQARRRAGAGEWGPDHTLVENLAATRGGRGPFGVRVHSVRLPGLVAHQEVLLGAVGQTLTIRHDTYDRRAFMPGVVLAVKAVADRPGLTVGLAPLLGMTVQGP
jgi:4-hydroxy-tetrahydrodipicolinate reductase